MTDLTREELLADTRRKDTMMETTEDLERALAPAEAPERTALADHLNPSPMPDVNDSPVVLVERAYKAVCDAGAQLTDVAQLDAIREQEEVLAKAAEELHRLRISLQGNDPGEYIIAMANDVAIPIPATALMMPKQSEVKRHMQKLDSQCTEFLDEWQRRRETLRRAAKALDGASMLTGVNGGDGVKEAGARVDDGVREIAQLFQPRSFVRASVVPQGDADPFHAEVERRNGRPVMSTREPAPEPQEGP